MLHIAARVVDKDERLEAVAADYDLAAIHHALAYDDDHPEEMQEWRERKRDAGRRAAEIRLTRGPR